MTSLSKAEKSYIQSSLLSDPPLRLDGRSLEDYRPIALETGVVPLANGSAKVCIGRPGRGGYVQEAGGVGGGTEVVAGVKLEVAGVGDGEGGGKVACTVSCSPAAYPSLSSNALDDLQSDLTILLESVLSHPSLRPNNLVIVPGKKAWAVKLDAVVFADGGNVVDCLMLACRAALWDTKVPLTKWVEYRAPRRHAAQGDVGMDVDVDEEAGGGFETKGESRATDFELTDYWDEGEVLSGRESWPVCVTLNVLSNIHFLDAKLQEEASVPLRMYVMYAFPRGKPILQTFRLIGPEVSTIDQLRGLIKRAESYARNTWTGLEAKLKDEEARRGVKAREKFYGRLG
ncbi:ribosomal protein S5 domain 2-type protein [Boletus edulis]|uniref:Ribosomal RNA-processing protein 42 n=1 Tax=Boletus edulis BED1 TaxID=1328754 RepID=A0AAD4GA81_BOLED|nr:ribosomal protein S5 domain 2-type protein [Boletus edulis]KAF8431688.1 ribosomal protein S5 domain 2-type protein [Boletus edulis BED1]